MSCCSSLHPEIASTSEMVVKGRVVQRWRTETIGGYRWRRPSGSVKAWEIRTFLQIWQVLSCLHVVLLYVTIYHPTACNRLLRYYPNYIRGLRHDDSSYSLASSPWVQVEARSPSQFGDAHRADDVLVIARNGVNPEAGCSCWLPHVQVPALGFVFFERMVLKMCCRPNQTLKILLTETKPTHYHRS